MKKILIFLMVLSLGLFLIPNQKISAAHRQNGIYFGEYYYEQGGTSDSYILRPRVRYYTTTDITNNRVALFDGKPYWIGSLTYLAQNRTTYYGNDTPIFSLSNSGYFTFSELDILHFYNGTSSVEINPASLMVFQSNNIRFIYNGNVEYEFTSFSNSSELSLIKDYSLDPDYYDGYEVGKQEGLAIGKDIGYYDGFQDGFDIGLQESTSEAYDNGYSAGKHDGYNEGYNEGLTVNPNNNFGTMIITVLSGVGTVLSIELLPGISIGAIIAVPIIFGIIAFVLGRRKD